MGELYHYTNTDGVLGIVKQQEHTIVLWFTYYKCLNDISEGIDFKNTYNSACEEMLSDSEITDEEFTALTNIEFSDESITAYTNQEGITHLTTGINDYYICCFCRNGDSLNMWRYYGNGETGYALGFLEQALSKQTKIDHFSSSEEKIGSFNWYNVVYDDAEKKKLIKNGILKTIKRIRLNPLSCPSLKSGILLDLWAYRFAFKHSCFASEEEVRCVLSIPHEQIDVAGKNKFTIKYREKNGIIIPYIPIVFSHKALLSIKLSPTATKDAETSLRYYTDGSTIRIDRSQLPIRF